MEADEDDPRLLLPRFDKWELRVEVIVCRAACLARSVDTKLLTRSLSSPFTSGEANSSNGAAEDEAEDEADEVGVEDDVVLRARGRKSGLSTTSIDGQWRPPSSASSMNGMGRLIPLGVPGSPSFLDVFQFW